MCMLCTGHLLKNAYDELTAILGWTNCKQILAKDELTALKMSYLNQRWANWTKDELKQDTMIIEKKNAVLLN